MWEQEMPQWWLDVIVLHGPAFGHKIRMHTETLGRTGRRTHDLGSWKGLGVPEPVFREAGAVLLATFEEHLITRYGIQGEMPTMWAGEVGPF